LLSGSGQRSIQHLAHVTLVLLRWIVGIIGHWTFPESLCDAIDKRRLTTGCLPALVSAAIRQADRLTGDEPQSAAQTTVGRSGVPL
jgi:hypothetical protein